MYGINLYVVYGISLYGVYGISLYGVYGISLYGVYGISLYGVHGIMSVWTRIYGPRCTSIRFFRGTRRRQAGRGLQESYPLFTRQICVSISAPCLHDRYV